MGRVLAFPSRKLSTHEEQHFGDSVGVDELLLRALSSAFCWGVRPGVDVKDPFAQFQAFDIWTACLTRREF